MRRCEKLAPKEMLRPATKEPLVESARKSSRKRKPRRNWKAMEDAELVAYAREFVGKNEILDKQSLKKKYWGLYDKLRSRKLLGRIGFPNGRRRWSALKDGEVIQIARRTIEENGLRRLAELRALDVGLYNVIQKRKLTEVLGLKKQRKWSKMDDAKLIRFAQNLVDSANIRNQTGLKRHDPGLHGTLVQRRLIGSVKFKAKKRSWAELSGDEVLQRAKTYIKKEGISTISELRLADSGMYAALHSRGMFEDLGLAKRREWAPKSDMQIVLHAQRVLEILDITSKSELTEADAGLYQVLYTRGLLPAAFSKVKSKKQQDGLVEISDAVEEFAKTG